MTIRSSWSRLLSIETYSVLILLKLYMSWYETLFFADRAVIAAILNSLDILLFRSVIRYTADKC